LVALMISLAALHRRESRGGHFRSDFPLPDPALKERRMLTLETTLHAAWEIAETGPRGDDA
jgi:L-aspartate oxidase